MSQGFATGYGIDTDPTLAANSDLLVASQKAIKTYVGNEITDASTTLSTSITALNTYWNDVLDLDFSAQASQTLGTDTTYTIAGMTWTKQNSTNDSTAMALTSGSGLIIIPKSTSDYASATRTAPILRVPMTSIYANWYPGLPIRVWAYVSSFNGAANYDNTWFGMDNSATTFAIMALRGRTGSGQCVSINADFNSTSTYVDSTLTVGATNACMMLEMREGMQGPCKLYVGSIGASNAWPAETTLTLRSWFAPTSINLGVTNFSNAGLFFAAGRAGSGTALSATFMKTKVQIPLIR